MHPLLLMPIAYFILNEPITKVKVISLVGACIGVVILSYNKNEDEHGNHEYYYVGIALILISWIGAAGLGVILRILSMNIHPALCPTWYSISTLTSVVLFLIFYPSIYNFSDYSMESCSWFLVSGVLVYLGINFESWAWRYAEASFVASFLYLKIPILSVFDIAVFHYTFSLTDIIGFVIILTWVLAPIFIIKVYH